MTKVIQFPKRVGPPTVAKPRSTDFARLRAALPPASTVRGVLAAAWLVIRLPLFLVMYWLRLPVMLVCNFVSVPALLALGFTWWAWPEKTQMLVAFGVVSFGAFAVLWLYDFVLMALSPQDTVRMM